ncbi:TRAP transporter small permease [Pseudolabrys taiwanensis]|nr:TRAP transporter small permease [Pseudolabrys taiwanensis]
MQDERPKGLLNGVSQAARTLLGLILLAMVLLNVVNAVSRYALSYVVIGIDELLVFAMIWMVMIGMLLVTADRSHIALEIVTGRVGPRTRSGLALLHHVVIAISCAYAAWQSVKFVMRVIAIQQTSMALELPMAIPHAAITVGLGGTALISAVLAVRDVRGVVSPRLAEQPA